MVSGLRVLGFRAWGLESYVTSPVVPLPLLRPHMEASSKGVVAKSHTSGVGGGLQRLPSGSQGDMGSIRKFGGPYHVGRGMSLSKSHASFCGR